VWHKSPAENGKLTSTALTSLESFPGNGVFAANATQLAKIVANINISKALKLDVKRTTTNSGTYTSNKLQVI